MNPVISARPNANIGAIFWVDFSALVAFPDTIAPTPSISINDVTRTEGNSGTSNFVFSVTRSANTPAISVQYQTDDSTASAPTDYTSLSSTLNFGSGGPLTQTITISVMGDSTVEQNETFNISLSNCSDCSIIDAQGVGTITNDDSVPVDTESPVIAVHSDVNAVASSASGATVSYTSPATSDNIDASGLATCSPLSGTTFAIGTTTVTCNATDNAENQATPTTFDVIVSDLPTGSILFSDDFESGFAKWTETGEGDWNLESPDERQVPGHSSNLVAHSDKCKRTCTITMSTPIDLSSQSSVTLSFWRYIDQDLDNGEYLKVELYDGTQWNTISNWTNNSGDDDTWHQETVNLDTYLGVSDFNVRFVTHESHHREIVEIDDVIINTTNLLSRDEGYKIPDIAIIYNVDDIEVTLISINNDNRVTEENTPPRLVSNGVN
jgi:hypothetical protein